MSYGSRIRRESIRDFIRSGDKILAKQLDVPNLRFAKMVARSNRKMFVTIRYLPRDYKGHKPIKVLYIEI